MEAHLHRQANILGKDTRFSGHIWSSLHEKWAYCYCSSGRPRGRSSSIDKPLLTDTPPPPD